MIEFDGESVNVKVNVAFSSKAVFTGGTTSSNVVLTRRVIVMARVRFS